MGRCARRGRRLKQLRRLQMYESCVFDPHDRHLFLICSVEELKSDIFGETHRYNHTPRSFRYALSVKGCNAIHVIGCHKADGKRMDLCRCDSLIDLHRFLSPGIRVDWQTNLFDYLMRRTNGACVNRATSRHQY